MDRSNELAAMWESLPHRPRLLVVGDLMLDRYTSGKTDRISPEAPVLVLQTQTVEQRLGGAGSVCHMASALGADVTALGVIGNDSVGQDLRQSLREANVSSAYVLEDPQRKTTLKERFVGRNGTGLPSQILRVDTETRRAIDHDVENRFIELVLPNLSSFDAILISDYGKGVCTRRLLESILQQAKLHQIPVLVDPARDADYSKYARATLIKPNRSEASSASGYEINTTDDAISAGLEICSQYEIDTAVITLDVDGMCLVRRSGEPSLFPTAARSVYDITGAGDMVLSVLGVALACNMPVENAIQVANIAAGLEIDRAGVAVLARDEIATAIRDQTNRDRKALRRHDVQRVVSEHRQRGKTIAFTNGCFDLLHVGHVTYLEEAASLADVLIVGVNSDRSVQQLKGPQRPVINERDRIAMLTALSCVDHVILFDADTPCDLIRAIRPDVLVKGGTYTKEQVVGHEIVEAYGGRVCVTNVVDGVSTTKIVNSVSQRTSLRKAG